MKIDITVFTPTYNRGYILGKLYKSLQQQTYKRFEWIIVDDGSTDDTESMVSKWIELQNTVDIRYKKVANHGKHVAINTGVEIARGDLFFIVDSDDYLPSTALERVMFWYNTIESETLFAGVCGNRAMTNGELIGKTFTGQYLDCTTIDRDRYGIQGDKAEVYYTDILKKYPFPVFEGENFCSEAVVWNQIAMAGYKLRFFNEVIYCGEYLEDGLSFNLQKKYLANPKGTMLFFKDTALAYKNSWKNFLKYASWYFVYGNKFGCTMNWLKNDLNLSHFNFGLIYIVYLLRKYIKGQ